MNQGPETLSAADPANPYAPPAAQPGAAREGAYEFTDEQNQLIAKMHGAMRFVGVVSALMGGLLLVAAGLQAVGGHTELARVFGHAVDGSVQLLYGVWTLSAAAGFARVVATEGDDIQHVMVALENLRKYFALVRAMIILGIALMLIGLVALVALR